MGAVGLFKLIKQKKIMQHVPGFVAILLITLCSCRAKTEKHQATVWKQCFCPDFGRWNYLTTILN